MTALEESNSSLKVQLMGGGASGAKKDSQVRIMRSSSSYHNFVTIATGKG